MKRLAIIMFSVLWMPFSCSKSNVTEVPNETELKVKASVVKTGQTKAIITGTSFSEGMSIGIELLKFEDNSAYSELTNVKFTSDGSGNWNSTENYILNPVKAKVYGYYPYIVMSDNTQPFFTIPVSVKSKAEFNSDTDYMYATPIDDEPSAAFNANSLVNLQMNHSLAQISLLVYKDNYNGEGKLTDFFIEDAQSGTSHIIVDKDPNDIVMDITNGSITGGEKGVIERNLISPIVIEASSADPLFPADDISILKNQVLTKGVSALVIPTNQIEAGDIRFSFNIDGTTYSICNSSQITWQKGKQYIYKIKLSGTSLNISQVSITEWETVLGDDLIIQ